MSFNYRYLSVNTSAKNRDTLVNSYNSILKETTQQTTSALKTNTNGIPENLMKDIPPYCLLSLVDDPMISTFSLESVLDSSSAALDQLVIPYISRWVVI